MTRHFATVPDRGIAGPRTLILDRGAKRNIKFSGDAPAGRIMLPSGQIFSADHMGFPKSLPCSRLRGGRAIDIDGGRASDKGNEFRICKGLLERLGHGSDTVDKSPIASDNSDIVAQNSQSRANVVPGDGIV